jgi:hypothetical protein
VHEALSRQRLDGPAHCPSRDSVGLLELALAGQHPGLGVLPVTDLGAQNRRELLMQRRRVALINDHLATVRNGQVRLPFGYRLYVLYV